MTDLEVIRSIFDQRKVGYSVYPRQDYWGTLLEGHVLRFYEDCDKFNGYYGFYGELHFDKDGTLIGTGAWE
jgi:hypothetical protein